MAYVLQGPWTFGTLAFNGGLNYLSAGQGSMTGGNPTEADVKLICRVPGVLSNLQTYVLTNTVSSATTLTLRKNGAGAALTLSVPASTTGAFFDNTHTVSVADGDALAFEINKPAGAFNFFCNGATVVNTPTGAAATQFHLISNSTVTNGSFNGLLGSISTTTTETNARQSVPCAGTWSNLFVRINANTFTNTSTYRSRINGAYGNQTLTVPASTTGDFEDTTHSDTVAAQDYLTIGCTQGSGSGSATVSLISSKIAPTAGGAPLMTGTGNATASSQNSITGGNSAWGSSADTIQSKFVGAAAALMVYVTANLSTAIATVKLRKNGTAGNQSVAIPASTAGIFQDTTHTDAIAASDTLDYQITGLNSTVTMRNIGLTLGDGVMPAAGSAVGVASVAATGLALGRSVGTAAGLAVVAGVGVAYRKTTGAAVGAAIASGVGVAYRKTAGAAVGLAVVAGVGKAFRRTVGSAVGVAVAAATGKLFKRTVGSAVGAATASATGRALRRGAGSSVGLAVVSGGAASRAAGAGAAIGVAIVTGLVVAYRKTVGSAVGAAIAAATGKNIHASPGMAVGLAIVAATGVSRAAGAGAAVGAGVATGAGNTLDSHGAGHAVGIAIVQAVGQLAHEAHGNAVGVAVVAGVGRALRRGAGSAVGAAVVTGAVVAYRKTAGSAVGAAIASGAGRGIRKGAGSAVGLGTAAGGGRWIRAIVGSAVGAAVVSGGGRTARTGAGAAIGIAIGAGATASKRAGAGSAVGAATAAATGRVIRPGVGLAVGTAVALGRGNAFFPSRGNAFGQAFVNAAGQQLRRSAGHAVGVAIAGARGQAATASTGHAVGAAIVLGGGFAVLFPVSGNMLRAENPFNSKAVGDFLAVNAGASRLYGFDFVNTLAAGDAIDPDVDIIFVLAPAVGVDANPAQWLIGDPYFLGTQVIQRISGLVAGVTYTLKATVQTVQGNTLDLWAYLECQPVGCCPSAPSC